MGIPSARAKALAPRGGLCLVLAAILVFSLLYQYPGASLRSPADDPRRRDHANALATSLRKQLFIEICSDPSRTSKSGAWCLFPTNDTIPGQAYAMAHHHAPADKGIASAVMAIVKPSQRLLDLGCGIGQYGHFFSNAGAQFSWQGYDGAVNVEEYTHGYVRWMDLSVPGFLVDESSKPDWVMALEIGEHVPASLMETLIDNIARNNRCGAIVSWAIPGQGGHAHVNELPNEEIIGAFVRRGYSYNAQASARGREGAVYPWFKNTFMVFDRVGRPGDCQY